MRLLILRQYTFCIGIQADILNRCRGGGVNFGEYSAQRQHKLPARSSEITALFSRLSLCPRQRERGGSHCTIARWRCWKPIRHHAARHYHVMVARLTAISSPFIRAAYSAPTERYSAYAISGSAGARQSHHPVLLAGTSAYFRYRDSRFAPEDVLALLTYRYWLPAYDQQTKKGCVICACGSMSQAFAGEWTMTTHASWSLAAVGSILRHWPDAPLGYAMESASRRGSRFCLCDESGAV